MSKKWDQRWMKHAFEVAGWSKDPRTQVGAVLVHGKNENPIPGYNGFPKRIEDRPERYADRELKNKIIIHAERNAILNAKRDLTGWTLYCTLPPCTVCASEIIQVEIGRVVVAWMDPDTWGKHENYHEDWALAQKLFREAGVTYDVIVYPGQEVPEGERLPVIDVLELTAEETKRKIEELTRAVPSMPNWPRCSCRHNRYGPLPTMPGPGNLLREPNDHGDVESRYPPHVIEPIHISDEELQEIHDDEARNAAGEPEIEPGDPDENSWPGDADWVEEREGRPGRRFDDDPKNWSGFAADANKGETGTVQYPGSLERLVTPHDPDNGQP